MLPESSVILPSFALESPRYLSDVSAWIQHIPFAYAAMELLRPGIFVELGTHKGDSYCAFCQAASERQLQTRCYAVDTWAGDSQAGHYTSEILRALKAHHDPLYATFSTLLQMTFDDALGSFGDGSVDLLHIDGLHTYEAVRHDFESWLPKMSRRGVVLLHDTNARHGDFGVYKLWAELAGRYVSFEFLHGSGLGVLAVGMEVPAAFLEFLGRANGDPETYRTLYTTLGHRLELARTIGSITTQLRRQAAALAGWRAGTEQLPLVTPALSQTAAANDSLRAVSWEEGDAKREGDYLLESVHRVAADVEALAADNANVRKSLQQARLNAQNSQQHAKNLQHIVDETRAHVANLEREMDREREGGIAGARGAAAGPGEAKAPSPNEGATGVQK